MNIGIIVVVMLLIFFIPNASGSNMSIILEYPSNGTIYNHYEVPFYVHANYSNSTDINWTVEVESKGEYSSYNETIVDDLRNNQTIIWRVYDGNDSIAISVSFKIDVKAPLQTINTQINENTYQENENITINLTFTDYAQFDFLDNNSPSHWYLTENDGIPQLLTGWTGGDGLYSYYENVTRSSGEYKWNFTANDTADNWVYDVVYFSVSAPSNVDEQVPLATSNLLGMLMGAMVAVSIVTVGISSRSGMDINRLVALFLMILIGIVLITTIVSV